MKFCKLLARGGARIPLLSPFVCWTQIWKIWRQKCCKIVYEKASFLCPLLFWGFGGRQGCLSANFSCSVLSSLPPPCTRQELTSGPGGIDLSQIGQRQVERSSFCSSAVQESTRAQMSHLMWRGLGLSNPIFTLSFHIAF